MGLLWNRDGTPTLYINIRSHILRVIWAIHSRPLAPVKKDAGFTTIRMRGGLACYRIGNRNSIQQGMVGDMFQLHRVGDVAQGPYTFLYGPRFTED